jgi:hypothetical protein
MAWAVLTLPWRTRVNEWRGEMPNDEVVSAVISASGHGFCGRLPRRSGSSVSRSRRLDHIYPLRQGGRPRRFGATSIQGRGNFRKSASSSPSRRKHSKLRVRATVGTTGLPSETPVQWGIMSNTKLMPLIRRRERSALALLTLSLRVTHFQQS